MKQVAQTGNAVTTSRHNTAERKYKSREQVLDAMRSRMSSDRIDWDLLNEIRADTGLKKEALEDVHSFLFEDGDYEKAKFALGLSGKFPT